MWHLGAFVVGSCEVFGMVSGMVCRWFVNCGRRWSFRTRDTSLDISSSGEASFKVHSHMGHDFAYASRPNRMRNDSEVTSGLLDFGERARSVVEMCITHAFLDRTKKAWVLRSTPRTKPGILHISCAKRSLALVLSRGRCVSDIPSTQSRLLSVYGKS